MLAEFPGIGPRQARRAVQFLLAAGAPFREKLARLIVATGVSATTCGLCFRFDDMQGKKFCSLCIDPLRDHASLMVVEKDIDVESVESSSAYRGSYFVLGGLKTMTERKNGAKVRSKELLSRILKSPLEPETEGIKEVIFALSTTPEGDYTARELMREVKAAKPEIIVTLLGRGLSVGAEIEYADSETLRSALKNRA